MNLKRIILAVVIVTLSFLLPIKAAKVPLEWDDDNPPTEIRGYPVYMRLESDVEGAFVERLFILAPPRVDLTIPVSCDLDLPAPGRWLCYVTAKSFDGIESEASNTISFYAPKAPMRLKIAGTTVSLESSEDMQEWKTEEVFYMDRSARRRFYRTSFDF